MPLLDMSVTVTVSLSLSHSLNLLLSPKLSEARQKFFVNNTSKYLHVSLAVFMRHCGAVREARKKSDALFQEFLL